MWCRHGFYTVLKDRLRTSADDHDIFRQLTSQLRLLEGQLEAGHVAVHHLELMLTNTTTDQVPARIQEELLLPIIADRLERAAVHFAAEQADEKQREILEALLEVSN